MPILSGESLFFHLLVPSLSLITKKTLSQWIVITLLLLKILCMVSYVVPASTRCFLVLEWKSLGNWCVKIYRVLSMLDL